LLIVNFYYLIFLLPVFCVYLHPQKVSTVHMTLWAGSGASHYSTRSRREKYVECSTEVHSDICILDSSQLVKPLQFTRRHALSCSQLCTYYRTVLPLVTYVAVFLLNIYCVTIKILFLFNLSVIHCLKISTPWNVV